MGISNCSTPLDTRLRGYDGGLTRVDNGLPDVMNGTVVAFLLDAASVRGSSCRLNWLVVACRVFGRW